MSPDGSRGRQRAGQEQSELVWRSPDRQVDSRGPTAATGEQQVGLREREEELRFTNVKLGGGGGARL